MIEFLKRHGPYQPGERAVFSAKREAEFVAQRFAKTIQAETERKVDETVNRQTTVPQDNAQTKKR